MKMPRKIPGNVRNKEVDLHYTEKRQKNNDAVKKSREKTRQKAKETMEKVTQLKQVGYLSMSLFWKKKTWTKVSLAGEWNARGENQVTGEGVDIPEGHLHGARRFCSWHHCGRHGDQGAAWGGGGELLTQDYQLNNSLTFFFSGPNERIGILKFAFELLQIETQCARAILRQDPDLVIIFRLWKASVDAAGKDGSLAGLGSGALMPCQAIYKKKYLLCLFPHWTKINENPFKCVFIIIVLIVGCQSFWSDSTMARFSSTPFSHSPVVKVVVVVVASIFWHQAVARVFFFFNYPCEYVGLRMNQTKAWTSYSHLIYHMVYQNRT